MIKSIINFVFAILVFILIIDPGDRIFHLKIPLFFLVLILWFFYKTSNTIFFRKDIAYIVFVFLMLPIISVVICFLQGNFVNMEFALGFLKSFSIIVLLFPIVDINIPTLKYLINNSLLLPIIVLSAYVIFLFIPDMISPIYSYTEEKDIAKFGYRNYYGFIVVMLYYRTTPLLVFPLAYFCNKFTTGDKKVKSFLLACTVCFTLILSGTRANIVSALGILLYYIYIYYRNKKNKIQLILLISTVIFALITFIGSLSFDEKDESTEVKSGHFTSYVDLFNSHPEYLIWGQGLGSEFYSKGASNMTPQTELTYLDMIRFFGIPMMIILLVILFYPIYYIVMNYNVKEYKFLIIAYFTYLFIAGTNPLLVSSTGILVIIVMYSLIKNKNNVHDFSLHSHL
ncbi:hypothetical protein [Flavobacterium sp.]|uniref:hypothetical protein n=1 Tax=Flavobacterium sp. TaxID=239 RepID=UPI00374DBC8E